ncbi:MAG TPA: DUF1822 family protein, partial [Candidatus Obscuribacterales bacterium]
SSYSWNRVTRLCADVADLKVTDGKLKKIGHIECRPVKAGEQFAYIPPEVWDERIGYLFVQFTPDYRQGSLLGFLPTVFKEQIPLDHLQPLEKFLEFLYQPAINWLRLSNWFDNIFPNAWQAIEEVINNQGANPALAFRLGRLRFDNIEWLRQQLSLNTRGKQPDKTLIPLEEDPIPALIQIIQTTQDEETRWKAAEMLWGIEPTNPASGTRRIIDLGMQLGGYPIALMVAILQKPDQKVAVLLRVYPMGDRNYLPFGLKLSLCDSANPNRVVEVQSRVQPLDNYIQLKFIAEYGEKFSVKVSLDDASFTEYFVI